MSYLLDKKNKRKKFLNVIFLIGILFFLFYFRFSVFNGFSYVSQIIFRPVLILGNNLGEKFSNVSSFFSFKDTLIKDNENLRLQLGEKDASLLNHDSVLNENTQMKEILGRKKESAKMILSGILAKPNQSLYDTLIIDIGLEHGISKGQIVFALGDIPIGRIAEVYPNSSKVILFSNPGEKTEVVIGKPVGQLTSGNVFMQIVGRGGGNFEMSLIKDLVLEKGSVVFLPGINSYVLGIVETTISDPRYSFQKVLLVSPVNIQELRFVEIEQ